MTRRTFFTVLFSCLPLRAETAPRAEKYYITGGFATTDGTPRDDCKVPAVVAYGRSRLDAFANSGVVVWTAQEYFEFRDRPLGKPCAK